MPLSRKKSCVRCRHSKLRCNQGFPSCSRCIERGTRCTYDWLIGPTSRDVRSGYSGSVRSVPKLSMTSEETPGFMHPANTRSESDKSTSATEECLPEATNDLFEQFDLDFVAEDVSAEQSFCLSKLPSLLDESNDSQLFSQQFLAQNIEVRRGESTSSHRLDSSMGSPGDFPIPNRPLQPWQNTSSQLSGILRRRGVIRHCLSSNIVLGQLTSYPKMMLQDKTLPPFIFAPCHLREELRLYCAKSRKHQCLPKELAICASLVDMFYSRTPNNADFVWSMIYAEQDRLRREHTSYNKYQLLAALQAVTIYVLLQASDVGTSEINDSGSLLESVIEISTRVGERNKLTAVSESNGVPSREEWIHVESVKRTTIILFTINLLLEGIVEHRAMRTRSPCSEWFNTVPLPSSRNLWEAGDSFIWRVEYEKYLAQRQTNRALTVGDLVELTEGGSLIARLGTDSRSDIVSDIFAWCDSLDSLGSLLWMVIPYQKRRSHPGMNEAW